MSDSDYNYLKKHREIWQTKPVLRRIYEEQFYSRLLDNRAAGQHTLEIGSGPGLLQEFAPEIWRTDILTSPWIHCTSDAHHLPFADESLDNVIGLDVLHHFSEPVKVLNEINRVLRVGGKFMLVEPWITPFSWLIYTYLHQEECDLSIQPWLDNPQFGAEKQAFDGNAAIPYLLVTQGNETLKQVLPDLQLQTVEPFSLASYLLCLGFKPGNLLPMPLYRFVYGLEELSRPIWSSLAALRVLLIWEKAVA